MEENVARIEDVRFTKGWHGTFAGGHMGLLLVGPVDNARRGTGLDARKRVLATELREQYGEMTRPALQALPVLGAYRAYYRQFGNTYHVQLQLESVVHKGKALPAVNPAVDACFAAELETQMLTASHDADRLAAPLTVDVTTGEEVLQRLNGRQKQVKAGDMMMADAEGPICTILYGQNRRTAVTEATQRVLYVTYAPPGITRAQVAAQHRALLRNVALFAPEAKVAYREIVTAGNGDALGDRPLRTD